MIYNVLIANRGLSALKFIISMKEWLANEDTDLYNVTLYGIVTDDDILCQYKYINELDKQFYVKNNNIYNEIDNIIILCKKYNITHVFPGWGYLSENEIFVKELQKNNINFIGPTFENMCDIGNKISCNNIAEQLSVPVLAWSGEKELKTLDDITFWCEKIGYPVMLKTGNSGGGKGIRIVRNKDSIYEMWQEIKQEIKDPMIYACKYIEYASHLEIQIVGDGENIIHLHGRDCTTQRRNQKLVEECPITKDKDIVNKIEQYAVDITKYIKYRGLATVEFIYDQTEKKVYILEVNPRIQVEHIITEQLFDLNLIKILFQVTTGTKITDIPELQHLNYNYNKHVISIRINSENAYEEFRPIIGNIDEIDITYNKKSWGYFSIGSNSNILGNVDSQFGHILVYDTTRKAAIKNMASLINRLKIIGNIFNTSSFLKNYITDETFRNNKHYTRYLHEIETKMLMNNNVNNDIIILLGMIYNSAILNNKKEQECLNSLNRGHNYLLKKYNQFEKAVIIYKNILCNYEFIYLLDNSKNKECVLKLYNKYYKIEFTFENDIMIINLNNVIYTVCGSYYDNYNIELLINQQKYIFTHKIKDNSIISSLSGKVVECVFKSGDYVNANTVYVKIECMKMIISLKTENSGIIEYHIAEGSIIKQGHPIGNIKNENNETNNNYIENSTILENFVNCGDFAYKNIIEQNNQRLLNTELHKANNIEITEYPKFFSNSYEQIELDDKTITGSKGWIINYNNSKFILFVNNIKHNNGVFSYTEDELYYKCLHYARINKMPFIFIASNSGAEININESIKYIVKPYVENNALQYLYITESEYELYKDQIKAIHHKDKQHYEITCINNSGVINLDGSALLVSEMAKARMEIPTITFVIDRTVGVGAYLARLSERIIQRKDSCILLTGFQAINKVLGNDLYESNMQLGGPNIMSNNGITHKVVNTTEEGLEYIKEMLNIIFNNENNIIHTRKDFPSYIYDIIDNNSFIETMSDYARNVVTGRCKINNKSYGLIFAMKEITEQFIPCDPANLSSSNVITKLSPNILYPNTSYKIAKTIHDCNVEGLDILIVTDWRGFSGGTNDMSNQILSFGSLIVTELSIYKNNVIIYIPPNGQLRGGSMVVFSKSINTNKIKFYVSQSARINVLEPSATRELKYKKQHIKEYEKLHNIQDEKLLDDIINKYVELNDVINTDYKVLNKYDKIIDAILEPSELKKIL